MMLVAVLLSAAAPPAAAPRIDAEVVITARPLADRERAWRACVEAGCDPRRQMVAALSYAEGQLALGDYRGSWRTLRTMRGRNLKHAQAMPLEVAQVARAAARLASLNGEPAASRIGAVTTVGSLKAGLANDDARIMRAQLDVGDAFIPEGRTDAALAQYARVARTARARQLPAIAFEADFRRALWLTRLAAIPANGGYAPSAKTALERIIANDHPVAGPYRDAARLLQINLLPPPRQRGALSLLIPTLTPRPADDPLLAYGPLIDTDRLVLAKPDPSSAQQWVDIDYRIAADGTVTDVAIKRGSRHLDAALSKAAAVALSRRRYAPLVLPPGEAGPIRHARFTFVFDLETPGSVSERSVRVGAIEPNEAQFQPSSGGSASSQANLNKSFEIVSRIPRYRSVPRIDVFELGSALARLDPDVT